MQFGGIYERFYTWYQVEFHTWSQFLRFLGAAVIGAIFGAFFSQRFKKYRRYILLALLGVVIIGAINASSTIAMVVGFIVGFIAAYIVLRVVVAAVRRRDTTFGSAEWADLEHLQQHRLIGEKGFWLGSFEVQKEQGQTQLAPIHYEGDRHLLTVAPTRAGKGVSSIIPNLLTYTGSALVIDPKGENAKITAARRGKGDAGRKIPGLNQTVHILDPWGSTGMKPSRFNPLDWLQPDDIDIGENALMLADAMVVSSPKGEDAFWDEEAKALLWGFILYVALDGDPEQECSLGRVRDLIVMGEEQQNEVLQKMYQHPNNIVRSTAARTLSKEPKLRSNVLTGLQSHTHFLDSPRIRESLSRSDFRFEDLKTSPMTVYLVLPADRLKAFGRWLRLIIQQAITVNARNIEQQPDKPILFLLDEMAALGRLTKVEEAFGLMAGFGMQLWGIVQDLSQLDRIYDKGWETFIGNSGVLQYFGSRDQKTAEYFSKLCGVTTTEKFSWGRAISRAIGFTSGGSGSSSNTTTTSDSYNYDVVQRHLAFPDELMVMREGQSLVLMESFNPIKAQKIMWYDDARLKHLGINLKEQGNAASMPA